MRKALITILLMLFPFSALSAVNDYTYMWWEGGYPYSTHKHGKKHLPVKIFQTSAFTFVWNVETLQVPHFGVLPQSETYEELVQKKDKNWKGLPAAKMNLSYTIGAETFTCVGANAPDRAKDWHRGARMIESGRNFQRADVWKLKFKNSKGEIAEKLARIECAFWSTEMIITFRLEEEAGDGNMTLTFNDFTETTPVKEGKGMARLSLELKDGKFTPAPPEATTNGVTVTCEKAKVDYTNEFQAHRIELFRSKSALPLPEGATQNDQIWEIPFTIKNNTDQPKDARLVLNQQDNRPFGQTVGEPITGVSMVMCDELGRPTGQYVQHSKNWHSILDKTIPYQFQWFRGLTKIPLKPGEEKKLKIRIFHGQYGGIPAASHAQLCLIGWGMNSLWEETALGAYGESFCYEPTRAHRDSFITDMRPLMLKSYDKNKKFSWTHNMGGGDFFIFERPDGTRLPNYHSRTTYLSHGPCLTETLYTGFLGDQEAQYEIRVFLARTDDVARATYHVKLDILKDIEISRSVIFSMGADYYNIPLEGKIAYGNIEQGVVLEWMADDKEHNEKHHALLPGKSWVSMHYVKRPKEYKGDGGIASRGMVIRSWNATLGGKPYSPYFYQKKQQRADLLHSQAELCLRPDIKTLKKGDKIESEIEFLLLPESTNAYYGENKEFKETAGKQLNLWQSIEREARIHDQQVTPVTGKLIRVCPDIKIIAEAGKAAFTVKGKQSRYTPVTITNLNSATAGTLKVNGQLLGQSIYGEDYYQTTYHADTATYSKTYNVKLSAEGDIQVTFE